MAASSLGSDMCASKSNATRTPTAPRRYATIVEASPRRGTPRRSKRGRAEDQHTVEPSSCSTDKAVDAISTESEEARCSTRSESDAISPSRRSTRGRAEDQEIDEPCSCNKDKAVDTISTESEEARNITRSVIDASGDAAVTHTDQADPRVSRNPDQGGRVLVVARWRPIPKWPWSATREAQREARREARREAKVARRGY